MSINHLRLTVFASLLAISTFASVPARSELFAENGNKIYSINLETGASTFYADLPVGWDSWGPDMYGNSNSIVYKDYQTNVVKYFDRALSQWVERDNFQLLADYNSTSVSANDLRSLVSIGVLSDHIQIGEDSNGVTITPTGISIAGSNLIKKSGGTVSIGENSLKLREQGGRQQMWATDANGDSIDIDVVNGSRLLINGRDVEKSIDNVGALSAALGSVPTVSADSQFTCGFGGGTHSSAYAFSGGCASRVSDRVSVNAALATVVNNQTGDADDNLSARAGFTFRLGKIDDSPKVAARKAAELHDKVAKLEERNESLIALLQAQASRLERLEQIASGQLSSLGDRASSD